MKGTSDYTMHHLDIQIHITIMLVRFSECPYIIILPFSFSLPRMPENRTIIANGIAFAFISTRFRLLEII